MEGTLAAIDIVELYIRLVGSQRAKGKREGARVVYHLGHYPAPQRKVHRGRRAADIERHLLGKGAHLTGIVGGRDGKRTPVGYGLARIVYRRAATAGPYIGYLYLAPALVACLELYRYWLAILHLAAVYDGLAHLDTLSHQWHGRRQHEDCGGHTTDYTVDVIHIH